MFAGRAFLYAVPDSLVDRTYPMDRTSVTRPAALATALLGLLLALATPSGFAQFDPARALREPEAIARQFPDPDVHYPTPGLREGRTDFPSHAEVLAYLDELAKASAGSNRRISVKIIGQSQQGRPMPLVMLSNGAGARDPSRPTILILGQQHGNEPAGGESALVLAQQLAGPRADLLDKVNVLIVPRSNPDGAEHFTRVTASGIDVNRDHLLLQTPEARAIAAVTLEYKPQVALDLHEFTVGGRWVDKFGAMQKYDALLQPATVGNLDPALADFAEREFIAPLHAMLAQNGLASFAYHTTSTDPQDKVVSMGGVQPDTGRNVSGLRPAISMLLEVRGVGLGRAHFLRRVHTQVLAAMTVIETAARLAPELIGVVGQAERAASAEACHGDIVIAAKHSQTRQPMLFVDAVTGADKPIEVAWRAATPMQVIRTRPRPCGYLLAASQRDAIERLRMLGATVRPVVRSARWTLERYVVTKEDEGQRQDARGAIEDSAPMRAYEVRTEHHRESVARGSVYVPLDQPLAPLIEAALEPDSQNSYAANRVLELEQSGLRRVMQRPPRILLGG